MILQPKIAPVNKDINKVVNFIEKPKVAKMDFFSSGEEEEPEPDTGETKELLIEDRAAVVGVILIVQSKYASICLLESQRR